MITKLDVKTRIDQKAAAVAGLWSAFRRAGLPGIDEHVKQSELARDAGSDQRSRDRAIHHWSLQPPRS